MTSPQRLLLRAVVLALSLFPVLAPTPAAHARDDRSPVLVPTTIITVETPVTGARFAGEIAIAGWAADPAMPP